MATEAVAMVAERVEVEMVVGKVAATVAAGRVLGT